MLAPTRLSDLRRRHVASHECLLSQLFFNSHQPLRKSFRSLGMPWHEGCNFLVKRDAKRFDGNPLNHFRSY